MNAEEIITALRAELAAAQETIAALTEQVAALVEQVAALVERVKDLEGQRATDSHNSSKPPSSDGPTRVPRSLRRTSGKKPGGQPAHPGAHLRLADTPDRVVVRWPLWCPACAASLNGVAVDGVERCQVVEMPPVRARDRVSRAARALSARSDGRDGRLPRRRGGAGAVRPASARAGRVSDAPAAAAL